MRKSLLTLTIAALSCASFAQTLCEEGFADIYPCENVDLWSFIPTDDMGGAANLNDIWGWTAATGREFAIVAKSNGTSFVEVTDPANPVYLGDLPTHTTNSLWRDVKVYQNHAFIVSEANGHGIQVFDLSQLLTLEEVPVVFDETAHYEGHGKAHNIAINEESGFAYSVGTTSFEGGLFIINIQDPTNPVIAGDFAEDGYTHDAQIVNYIGPDKDYCGQEIAFNCNENTLTIADVTDKTDAQLIAAQGYFGSSYSHQGWLTEDHKYFLLGDETDELTGLTNSTKTFIWDVQDLDSPTLLGMYNAPSTAIDHNMYIKGNMVFQSNYRSGLRILDASRVSEVELSELGFFDVQPDDDNASFSGTWSNYCYFPSGNVVVTDMYSGLFVLRPNVSTVDYTVTLQDDQDEATYSVDYTYNPGDLAVLVSNLPTGVAAEVGAVNTPGSTVVILSGLETLDPGTYDFVIVTDVDGEMNEHMAQVIITDDVDLFATAVSPADETLQPAAIELSWTSNGEENASYFVEVAEDDAFETVVHSETTDETTSTIPFDLPDGTYYWRVSVSQSCDEESISETTSFDVLFVNVNELDALEQLTAYPNPAETTIQINGLGTEDSLLELVSYDGRLITTYTVNADETYVMDVSSLASGVYVIRTDAGKTLQFTKK
ncbi:MAG: choice-of-anchor B family protein [Flavobacteriales bacterium]|nr:choice-of-anchor B family protein [Flavobacteriales bacterium]